MNDALARLLALADADGSLRTLDGRLADLDREERNLQERLAAEDAGFRRRQDESRALRLAALAKAGEADDTDAKIRTYQRKLDHDIIPYKEMEHLREQVAFLRARLDGLADEALGLMADADQDEEQLKTDAADHAARRARLEGELSLLSRRRAETLVGREGLREERERLLHAAPSHFRGTYARLLAGGGSPVVPMVGAVCTGCRLRLAETTVEKVKADREVVTCEHCSRFLYLRPS